MSTPIQALLQLIFPPDDGLPNATIQKAMAANFDSKSEEVYNLTGSGTQTVDLGSLPGAGAKLLVVAMDSSASASAVLLKINGATQGIEISPGGFAMFANPAPAAGITAVTITYTTPCKVKTWAFG